VEPRIHLWVELSPKFSAAAVDCDWARDGTRGGEAFQQRGSQARFASLLRHLQHNGERFWRIDRLFASVPIVFSIVADTGGHKTGGHETSGYRASASDHCHARCGSSSSSGASILARSYRAFSAGSICRVSWPTMTPPLHS
jgi:hypothetical protein